MKIKLLIFSIACLVLIISLQVNVSYAKIEKIKVTSTDFNNRGNIPDANACDFLGLNKSPQLSFSNSSPTTQSFALIMFDPDAPGKNFVHWIIFNIPVDSSSLDEGIPTEGTLEDGTTQGKNDTQGIGYFGPCPPPKETHRYVFKVYALDTILNLESGATKNQLTKAMKGHIVGRGKLIGLYKNKTNN